MPKIGDIVRVGAGSTALMKIETVHDQVAGYVRFYGRHCMGGSCGAYSYECSLASTEDLKTWEESAHWRGEKPFPKAEEETKSMNETVSPWQPITDKIDLSHLGKSIEEVGELIAELGKLQQTLARCVIQGIREINPSTGATNKHELAKEIADVAAQIELLIQRFNLDRDFIATRSGNKMLRQAAWRKLITPED